MVRRSVRSTPREGRSDIDWWPKAQGDSNGTPPSTRSANKPRLITRHAVPILALPSPRDSPRTPSVLQTLRRHRSYDRQPPPPLSASSRREARVFSVCPGIGTPAARSLFRVRLRADVPPRAVSSLSMVACEPPPLKHVVAGGQQASRRSSIASQHGEKHLAGWGEWEREFRARAEELAHVTKVKDGSRLG